MGVIEVFSILKGFSCIHFAMAIVYFLHGFILHYLCVTLDGFALNNAKLGGNLCILTKLFWRNKIAGWMIITVTCATCLREISDSNFLQAVIGKYRYIK